MGPVLPDLLEWWIELSAEQIAHSWQQSQTESTPLSHRRSFLNRLCLETFMPWFQTDYAPDARPWPRLAALPSIWEWVEGTVITVSNLRVVLLPTETIDTAELEIPREWVDLPEWAADYYLAIQINVQERWLQVWGYTTHAQARRLNWYDDCDRTYCLPYEALTHDLNAFWVSCQQHPQWANRDTLTTVSPLSNAEANALIHRLSQPDCAFPRVRVPLDQWSALIVNDHWRNSLHEARLSTLQPQTPSIVANLVNLRRWFEDWYDAEWQTFSTLLSSDVQLLTPSLRAAISDSDSTPQRIKWISLVTKPKVQRVMLLMTLTADSDEQIRVSIQLHPEQGQQYVPLGVMLTLSSDHDEVTVSARDRDYFIQLPLFTCPPGTHFNLQISLDNHQVVEQFVV